MSIELEAGGVVEGRVVSVDSRAVVVEVDGVQRTFANEQVRKYHFTELEGAEPAATAPPVAQAPVEPAVDGGGKAAPTARLSEAQQPEPDVGGATAPVRYRSLWQKRLDALDRRYPWLFPAEPLQWISLGVMLFALLSLAVHFAARMAASDSLQFGRALFLGAWLLLTSVGLLAVLPPHNQALFGAIVGNLVATTILYAIVYGLSFGGAVLAVFLLAIEGGIGFGLLQLVDATLRSIGNTTF